MASYTYGLYDLIPVLFSDKFHHGNNIFHVIQQQTLVE